MGIPLAFIFLANMVGAIVMLPALVRWLMRRREAEHHPLQAVLADSPAASRIDI